MKKRLLALFLLCTLVTAGCGRETVPASQGEEPLPSSSQGEALREETAPPSAQEPDQEPPAQPADALPETGELHPYLQELVDKVVDQIAVPGMSDYEKAKAAFDYMIENTYLDEPIGLELWRVHGGGEEPISYLEQRALSPLRFGVGMCEDYAAALTLILRGMGLQAQYVPGLTYSVEGNLVDHAWTAVEIDGTWYHLDSQLEDNVSRHGTVRYRYFLRGDETLSASHRWGQNLLDSGLLDEEQAAQLVDGYLMPACPQDYPTPERLLFEEPPAPDLEALRQEAAEELAAYEAENGPLAPMELNTTPPVFGLEGFGPANEG